MQIDFGKEYETIFYQVEKLKQNGSGNMSRWHPYNPNPLHARVGDCSVRAISKAIGRDWDTSYVVLCAYGFDMKNMPSGNCVWGALLKNHGFTRRSMEGYPKLICSVAEFCREHPQGLYVLGCDGHVVTVEDGLYWDSWDSGGETVIYYWESSFMDEKNQKQAGGKYHAK